MINDDNSDMVISFLILVIVSFMIGFWWFVDTIKEKKIVSNKRIVPQLQITGNGTNMDTVYIYKLEE